MTDNLQFLLDEFGDRSDSLFELQNFIEAQSSNPTILSYLLLGVITLAREQGELLAKLKPFGIETADEAIKHCVLRRTEKDLQRE